LVAARARLAKGELELPNWRGYSGAVVSGSSGAAIAPHASPAKIFAVRRGGQPLETSQANPKVKVMTAQPLPRSDETESGAPRKGRRRSYDESLDEPAKLISDEPVDVEKETPAEENEPVERSAQEDTAPPAFDEDDEPSG